MYYIVGDMCVYMMVVFGTRKYLAEIAPEFADM
jgi:hypothetical protein